MGLAALLLGLAFAAPSTAWADHALALEIAPENVGRIRAQAFYWHEKQAKASLEQVRSPSVAGQFTPLYEETMFKLVPQDRLWLRVELDRISEVDDDWSMWIPLPLLDSVTLHQSNEQKKAWTTVRAGDRIAVNDWPEPGRYPRFHLDLPMGKSVLFLEIQGSTPISVPLHLATEVQAQQTDRQGFLGMGLVMGVLLTLVLVCFVTGYTYRDRLYALYGGYVLLLMLAVGAYTGLSAYLLWPASPLWADAAQGCLALLTGGGAMYFVETLLAGRQFARQHARALLMLGALALPLAVVYYLLSRNTGVLLLGAYMLSVSALGLTLAYRAWRRGDKVGLWVFLAYMPLAVAVLMAVARAYGWISVSWIVQYGVVAALIVEVPMMMTALHLRSRQRHEIQTREVAMTTQDALTGLLTEHIFDDRLRQTMLRHTKRREDAAVILISLVNYNQIAATHGLPVAEQSLLRAVIKLRKVLRDVDTVARVGTAYFGVIIEGVNHRSRVTEIGARLIAQGLMPLPGLRPEVTLQFHLAAMLMREIASAQTDIKDELLTVLAGMSSRTRRPIRFLEPVTTAAMPMMEEQSSTRGGADGQAHTLAAPSVVPLKPLRGKKPKAEHMASSGWSTETPSSMLPTDDSQVTVQQPRSML